MKALIVSMSMVVALCTFGSVALANDPTPSSPSNERLQRLMTRFHKADTNGDGQLTREEAQKGMPLVYRHFAQIDTDNKGYVTLADIASYLEAHPESGVARPRTATALPRPPAASTPATGPTP
jgi:hypothetical protein